VSCEEEVAAGTGPERAGTTFGQQMLLLFPLVLGMLGMQAAAGVLGTGIPLQMALSAVSPETIGLVASAYAAGFAAGCLISPALIGRFGYRKALACFVMLQAAATVCLAFLPFEGWIALRAVMGACGAGAVVITEGWVNTAAPAEVRGRIFGTVNMLGRMAMVAGQAAAAFPWALGTLAFVGPALLYAIALAFMVPSVHGRPVTAATRGAGLGRSLSFLETPAVAAVGVIYVGAVGTTLISVAPAWGVLVGMSSAAAAMLTVSVQIGSFVLQGPLLWLSDRMDRRLVILFAAIVTATCALVLLAIPSGHQAPLFLIYALIGGVSLPVYALSFATAFDHGGAVANFRLSSGLLFNWALGAVIGPTVATAAIARYGPEGLLHFLVLTSAAVALLLARLIRRAGHPNAPSK